MKYDIRAYLKFEIYLWPGVGQLSQVKSVNCVKNFSIANKSFIHYSIKLAIIQNIHIFSHNYFFSSRINSGQEAASTRFTVSKIYRYIQNTNIS